MSMSDYRRPSQAQITNIYTCNSCGGEREEASYYAAPLCCGTAMVQSGESYPASSNDWDEERDGVNENGIGGVSEPATDSIHAAERG